MARKENDTLPGISQSQVDAVVSAYESLQNAKAKIPAVDEEWRTHVQTTVTVSIVEE